MVYRDYWALGQWYRHYAKQLGAVNLYVVAHGADEKVKQICPDASVLVIPRDDLDGFDRRRSEFLNKLQATLLDAYDWVIRTDADELICIDPDVYISFAKLFETLTGPVAFALGFEVVEQNRDRQLADDESVFAARHTVKFSGHYSKAWAVNQPEQLVRHGVQMKPKRTRWFHFDMPQGVYLAHLKYANRRALADANIHRTEVANGSGHGLPGKAWREADDEAARFYQMVASLPEVDWHTAKADAYQRLSQDPKRDAPDGIVRARQLRFKVRTTLPDWFQTF